MAHQSAANESVPVEDNTTWLDTTNLNDLDLRDDVCTKVEPKICLAFANHTLNTQQVLKLSQKRVLILIIKT